MILNIIVLAITLIVIIVSYYDRNIIRKKVYEVTPGLNMENFASVQKENYCKCLYCDTQNSKTRENCYSCNEKL